MGSGRQRRTGKAGAGDQHPRGDRGCPVGLAGSGWRGLVHKAERGERSRGSRHGGEEERRGTVLTGGPEVAEGEASAEWALG